MRTALVLCLCGACLALVTGESMPSTYMPLAEPSVQQYFPPLKDHIPVFPWTKGNQRSEWAQIPRKTNLTEEAFFDLIRTGQPFVVDDCAKQWPYRDWSCKQFGDAWPKGHMKVHDPMSRVTTLPHSHHRPNTPATSTARLSATASGGIKSATAIVRPSPALPMCPQPTLWFTRLLAAAAPFQWRYGRGAVHLACQGPSTTPSTHHASPPRAPCARMRSPSPQRGTYRGPPVPTKPHTLLLLVGAYVIPYRILPVESRVGV